MSYRFQFRDVLAQQDAIIDGLLMTLQLTAGTISLGFVIGLLVASVLDIVHNAMDIAIKPSLSCWCRYRLRNHARW